MPRYICFDCAVIEAQSIADRGPKTFQMALHDLMEEKTKENPGAEIIRGEDLKLCCAKCTERRDKIHKAFEQQLRTMNKRKNESRNL